MVEAGFDAYVPNPARAAEFYSQAHQLENTDATFNLGLLYLNTPDFEVDNVEAFKLIQAASIKGNARAQDYLVNIGFVNNRSEFVQVYNEREQEIESELEEEESKSTILVNLFLSIELVCAIH